MSTIELLTFDYLTFGENPFYHLLIIIPFAGIIGLFKKVESRMDRGAYFLNTALVVFGASIIQGIWFLSPDAIVGGYTFAIVLAELLIFALIAYAYIVLGKARSNDAYGHSGFVVLAFIPIVSIWLFFKPSKDKNAPKMSSLLSGVSAVIVGLVIYAAGASFSKLLKHSIENHMANNIEYEIQVLIGKKYFEYYAQRDGLEVALKYYKKLEEVEVGKRIDEVTLLSSIETTTDTITYKFLITDDKVAGYTQKQRNIWENYICNNNAELLELGATMVWHYYNEAIPTLAYIVGNKEICRIELSSVN
jgi:hypothetical protein